MAAHPTANVQDTREEGQWKLPANESNLLLGALLWGTGLSGH